MVEDSEVSASCPNTDNSKNVSQPTNIQPQVYQSSSEYFKALEKWLQDVYMWQSFMASFPYMLMSNQFFPNIASNPQLFTSNGATATQNGINTFPFAPLGAQFPVGAVPNVNADTLRNRRVPAPTYRPARQVNAAEGIEYRIPPVWKRMDYKMAMEMTSEILMLEMIHRVVVCIFEACWLRRGIGGRVGGATPGKAMMNIRVVLCETVSPIEGYPADVVVVFPGTDLGFFWAFSRSFVKNLVLSILFPVCFALFFFKHSRTGYDILCRTIVVEDSPIRRA